MANEILQKEGTPVVWADTTDYVATVSGFTRTHQLDLTSIADAAAQQGAKADLGATRARQYAVRVGIEMNAAPVSGAAVYFYWSSSFSGTAATGNDGFCTGSDAAYAGSEDDSIADSVKQLTLIGVLSLAVDFAGDSANSVQMATVGLFSPPHRYGQVVVWNESGQAFEGDAVEMFVALVPIIDEAQ